MEKETVVESASPSVEESPAVAEAKNTETIHVSEQARAPAAEPQELPQEAKDAETPRVLEEETPAAEPQELSQETKDTETLHVSEKHTLWYVIRHIAAGLLGFLLFIFALGLMKEGAAGLTPLLHNRLAVNNVADAMGVGWLAAYLIQSGSPVAAAAISLLSAKSISASQAYAMIAGSRLGAGLMVLQLGLVYALRGVERRKALTAGVLSLLLTGSILILTLPLGLLILENGWLDGHSGGGLTGMADFINLILDPALALFSRYLPNWMLFVVGIVIVSASFKLIDTALSAINLKSSKLGKSNRLIYRPVIMFLLGLGITVLTMSVSISVGILVPLSARGYVRRENMIPYLLGANISTLVDTLIAAVLLGEPQGVTVVMTHMIGASIVSLLIVLLSYNQYVQAVSNTLVWITAQRRNFAVFVGLIFLIPIVMMLC
ncbi:MAG: hypothetical protein JXB35_05420 [Anaerolineae bacterium]|nr:hypothetical protein [Anaerolineae bacterium]